MSELTDAFRKSWQKAGDDIKMMNLESPEDHVYRMLEIRTNQSNAWKEAFQATRAYYSNNTGPNAKRYREAVKRLKEMKLIK